MEVHPSRRAVLQAAGAGILSRAPGLAAEPPVVDTHIHLYDPTRPEGVPWPPKTDPLLYRPVLPAAFAAMVRPLGVTGAIVVEASQWIEDNQWVLDVAKDNPIILALVGSLEPATDDFRQNLARFAKNPLFRGIRLNGNAIAAGLPKAAFVDDLRRLADMGLMLDAIGSAAMISALLALTDKLPTLRVAIDHMPGEPTGWQARDDSRAALRQLARHPQVYAKVSGVLQQTRGKVAEDAASYRA